MSDSENDSTYISFNSISKGIKRVLHSKIELDGLFKQFTNDVNSLNSSIILYKEQLKSSSNVNNSNQSGKKKFCSNVNNNNNVDECNNNNNTEPQKRKTSCYQESNKQGKAEYQKGETQLEKAERLLNYQQNLYNNLKEKHQKTALKLVHEINLSVDNNNNVVDININIIFARDNNSDTTTKKNIKDKEKRKRDPKPLQVTNSELVYDEEYMDADIDADVHTKISESDTRDNAKVNQSSSTTSDLGAFESETVATSDSTTCSNTNN
jgi:hypothetical protein